MTKQEFINKAKKRGIIIHQENPKDATPFSKICGSIKMKDPIDIEELLQK